MGNNKIVAPKCPESALPILKAIREEVKRVPVSKWDSSLPSGRLLRVTRNRRRCCPMGLLPGAPRSAPTGLDHMWRGWKGIMIRDFYEWFDDIDNAKDAVKAVWGR